MSLPSLPTVQGYSLFATCVQLWAVKGSFSIINKSYGCTQEYFISITMSSSAKLSVGMLCFYNDRTPS